MNAPEVAPFPAVSGKSSADARPRRAVFVLGMHRSGTSALARVMSLLGCDLPATLIPAGEGNEAGHWESRNIVLFNDELLAALGTAWDDWLPVNPRFQDTPQWPSFVEKGRTVLRQEFADSPMFVLKDPRICRLLPFWLEVLASENVDPAIVIPLRNPVEVARSLAARNGFEKHYGLLLWLRHVLDAEAASRGRPRVFVSYDELIDDWELVTAKIATATDLVWPRMSPSTAIEIDAFLGPQLRHQSVGSRNLVQRQMLSPWIADTYAILQNWVGHGERSDDHERLDAIAAAFDAATPMFARPMLGARETERKLLQSEAERRALGEERDSLVEERDSLVEERASLSDERDGLLVERNIAIDARIALQRDHEGLAEQGRAVVDERDALAAQLEAMATERASLSDERDGLLVERDIAIDARIALQRDHEALAEQSRAVVDERDALAAQLEAMATEREALAGELQAEQLLASRHWDARCALEAQRDASQAQIATLEQEQVRSAHSQKELKHELAVTTSTLRQREEEIEQLGATHARHVAESAETLDALSKLQVAHSEQLDDLIAVRAEIAERFAETAKLTDMLTEQEAEIEELRQSLGEARDEQAAMLAARDAAQADRKILSVERDSLSAEVVSARDNVAERFKELSQLTFMLRSSEDIAQARSCDVEWLLDVGKVMARFPVWWALAPARIRQRWAEERLKRHGLFDADAYHARYRDVMEAGMPALRHYLLHGLGEGRSR